MNYIIYCCDCSKKLTYDNYIECMDKEHIITLDSQGCINGCRVSSVENVRWVPIHRINPLSKESIKSIKFCSRGFELIASYNFEKCFRCVLKDEGEGSPYEFYDKFIRECPDEDLEIKEPAI